MDRFTGVRYEEITDIVKTLEGKVPEIYAIGDGKEPRLMADAIADGAHIGHTI